VTAPAATAATRPGHDIGVGHLPVQQQYLDQRPSCGVLVVRKGQRRALAAVKAGPELVPVVVEPEPLADQPARDIDRIIDQLGENQHRAGLPVTDEVAAHQQLLDLGLTAGQIARATHTRPARVKASLAVGLSEVAAAALGSYDLSLEQAAVIADGDQAAVTALVAAAKIGPGQFEHVAQRARDESTETRLRTELTARLHTAGLTTIDRPEVGRGRSTVLGLNQLRPGPHAEPGTSIGEADHAELAEMLTFIADWLRHDHDRLEPSLLTFIGNNAYTTSTLRGDLARFTFLLGADNGTRLFDTDQP
jgi:ParB family chromosome partitioning protein